MRNTCEFLMASAIAAACLVCPTASRAETGFITPISNPQIISSDINVDVGYYTIINQVTGAERFYTEGFFGNNAMVANVEAGHVWNGHETLGNVTSYISNSPINTPNLQYDYHATMVGFAIVGLGPPPYYYYQFGMSPGAFLSSVAIATSFGGDGSFAITASTFVYGYKTVMQDGVAREIFPGIFVSRPVDVVNSSWGFEDNAGNSQPTMILDALAFANHQTVCVAAGNHSTGTALVSGPGSGFNCIAVGALGTDLSHPVYGSVADFSNTGPNDFYNPQTGVTTPGVRAAVSISAPGTELILAAYIGKTGSNAGGTLFNVPGLDPNGTGYYFQFADGTSFASPIVAGGASLMVDAGYAVLGGGVAVDGRVIKAVLLNSATKTAGWTNHTTLVGNVLKTSQGLDWEVGAGALNLNRGYDQYLSGTTDVPLLTGGTVHNVGWDFGHVSLGLPNNYFLETPLHQGEMLTATLTWFIDVYFNTNGIADSEQNFSEADLHNNFFDQLDLQVWLVSGGIPTTLIADSTSPYNNVDHLYFAVPQDGLYALRVSWLGTTYNLGPVTPVGNDYALAWSVTAPVPEPASLLLMGGGIAAVLRRRSRKLDKFGSPDFVVRASSLPH